MLKQKGKQNWQPGLMTNESLLAEKDSDFILRKGDRVLVYEGLGMVISFPPDNFVYVLLDEPRVQMVYKVWEIKKVPGVSI